jgi:hypothetical protein
MYTMVIENQGHFASRWNLARWNLARHSYWVIVIDRVPVCNVPPTAAELTVTAYEPTGVPGFTVGPLAGEDAAQPLRDTSTPRHINPTSKPGRFRLLRQSAPQRSKAAAAIPPPPAPLQCMGRATLLALEAVVVMVNVDVTGSPAGVTDAGEKLAVAPEGRPEQVNVTI